MVCERRRSRQRARARQTRCHATSNFSGILTFLGPSEIEIKNAQRSLLSIGMSELISLRKNPVDPDHIVRSLKDGPDYYPHWRFQAGGKYLIRLAQAQDPAATRGEIWSEAKDPFLRKFLAFHLDGRSSKSGPTEYALRCHRSRNENLTATKISAMVIAGRSSSEIAQEVGTTRANVVAYEKIFFDVRRYLDRRFWIKELCYFPHRMTLLEEGASRWLITACERGWNGLAFIFSTSRSGWKAAGKWNSESAGKSLSDMISLGLVGRLIDFIFALEMGGVKPIAQEMELLSNLGLLGPGLPASFHQLDYPTALSPNEEKNARKTTELISGISPAQRQRITNLIERLNLTATFPQVGQSKPSGSP